MRIKQIYKVATLLVVFTRISASYAQHDSLILQNGNTIVGEIKVLEKGVLTIETNYSKNDFTVKWSGIKEIYSDRIFLIGFEDGRRMNGIVNYLKATQKIGIKANDGQIVETFFNNVVYLKGLESDFWSNVKAGIDLGLSLAKANNLSQLTINTNLGYMADKWEASGYYNIITASQDSVETTKRTDAGLNYKYYLKKNWFLSASLNFLSNTEQALKLRTMGKLGGGKFLIHTNTTYWGVSGGLSFNNESFTNETPARSSLEGFFGSELNMFDIGDLSLLSSLFVYPSFTESGRWRSDFRIDGKYDLPYDIYLKLNLTFNYDNRPAVAGNDTDYLLGFSIGWAL